MCGTAFALQRASGTATLQRALQRAWRRTLRTALFVVIGSFLLSVFFPLIAAACSCAYMPPIEEQVARSDVIFAGEVLKVEQLRGSWTVQVLFEVSDIWKGTNASQVMIYTGSSGADCGYEFRVGQHYLVYAQESQFYSSDEQLVTTICDRTRLLVTADEDLAALGESTLPTKYVDLTKQPLGIGWYVVMTIVFIGGGIAFFLWRVRRTSHG